MSIFVDPEEIFEIRQKFCYIKNNDVITGVKIIEDTAEENEQDIHEIICYASGRDFDNMSKIMEDATLINHITGETMVRMSVLYRLIIQRFFKTWNVKDREGNIAPINSDSINKTHDSIVRALGKKWLALTNGDIN